MDWPRLNCRAQTRIFLVIIGHFSISLSSLLCPFSSALTPLPPPSSFNCFPSISPSHIPLPLCATSHHFLLLLSTGTSPCYFMPLPGHSRCHFPLPYPPATFPISPFPLSAPTSIFQLSSSFLMAFKGATGVGVAIVICSLFGLLATNRRLDHCMSSQKIIWFVATNRGSELLVKNKFVRTKMRLKLGTKIDLSERFVRFVRFCFPVTLLCYFFRDSRQFPIEFCS